MFKGNKRKDYVEDILRIGTIYVMVCSSTRWQTQWWCLFCFLSAVQRSQTRKLNWPDGKFSCQDKQCHNGRVWSSTTSVCRKPTDQRTKQQQETACHNTFFFFLWTQRPCWYHHFGTYYISFCGNSNMPHNFNFNFITWTHTARWHAARVLLQIVPSGQTFLSRPISNSY